MPAAVETFADGSAAFVAARKPAWHRLGTVFDVDALTAAQVMEAGKLGGWNVRKTPLTTTEVLDGQPFELDVPDKYAVVRTNPVTGRPNVLGVVGNQWTPVQNEDTCGFLQALADESGAVFETAGSLNDGRDVFVTMKLPETLLVGGEDAVDCYLSAFNNHSGTASFRATVSPVRVVCKNTQEMNLAAAKSRFAIRHTSGVKDAIEEARKALELTSKYLETFEMEATHMLETAYTDAEFEKLMIEMCGERPQDAKPKEITAWETEIGTLRYLFREADTQAAIRNTRWGAYQAVVEYIDWKSPVRSKKVDADQVRAMRTLTSADYTGLKQGVYELLKVG